MPWTLENPPGPAKNLPTEQRQRCVSAANSALKAGKSERDAIIACIGAAGMACGDKHRTTTTEDGEVFYVGEEVVYATKTEDGKAYPSGDFAYAPDREKPSTWKLRLTSTPGGPVDSRIVGAAVAALGKGFRGNKVQIPSSDLAAVKAKVRGAWKRLHPDMDVPSHLMGEGDDPKEFGELFELSDVDIFGTGKWNGDNYSEKDLDDMVSAFEAVGFRPPVKLGHSKDIGEAAYGWIKSIRRVGDKLVADLMDLPKSVYEAIKDRRYDHVSAELFWNMSRNGQKFRRVLKAVALLGAETPAVSGLRPLRESFKGVFSEGELELVHSYELTIEDLDMSEKEFEAMKAKLEAAEKEKSELEKKLAAKVKEHTEKVQGDDIALQLKKMQDEQQELMKKLAVAEDRERKATIHNSVGKLRVPAFKEHFEALYEMAMADPGKTVKFSVQSGDKEVSQDTPLVKVVDDMLDRINKASEFIFQTHARPSVDSFERDDVHFQENPGEEVDLLVKKYMSEKAEKDYGKAFDAVQTDPTNAELMKRYSAYRG